MDGERGGRARADPAVSVVIPTWNRLAFLPQAVDSVLGQTFEDLELIVVDDGSTDGTGAYLDGLADRRVRRVSLPHTGSVARVRNAGAAAARGRFLCFLDSDDVWLPAKLAVQVAATERAGTRWSYTRYQHMDEDAAPIPARAGRWRPLSGRIAADVLTDRASVGLLAVLMERTLFDELGGFDEKAHIHEDYELIVRLAAKADALAIPEPLAMVRVHPRRSTRGWRGAQPFLVSAATYETLARSVGDPRLRRAAARQRASYLAEAARSELADRAVGTAARFLWRAARAGASLPVLASALRRGIGPDRKLLRMVLRPFLGRETRTWLLIRSPRLRYRCFADAVDCVIYSLLLSRRRVRFVQVGSNDGVTDDPLWTFRRYPNWSGILVEPVGHVFERLAGNYARWSDRFALERAVVAGSGGIRTFHYLPESPGAEAGYDQGGSLDPARVRSYSRIFGLAEDVVSEPVRCLTFRDLCAKHGLPAPDLVHVDAEGMDAEIVRQVDLDRDPPAVILYEHVHLRPEDREALDGRLGGAGYETVEIGRDTLAVLRSALEAHPPLGTAWRLAVRTAGPA